MAVLRAAKPTRTASTGLTTPSWNSTSWCMVPATAANQSSTGLVSSTPAADQNRGTFNGDQRCCRMTRGTCPSRGTTFARRAKSRMNASATRLETTHGPHSRERWPIHSPTETEATHHRNRLVWLANVALGSTLQYLTSRCGVTRLRGWVASPTRTPLNPYRARTPADLYAVNLTVG